LPRGKRVQLRLGCDVDHELCLGLGA
jgi:hypothetical protein